MNLLVSLATLSLFHRSISDSVTSILTCPLTSTWCNYHADDNWQFFKATHDAFVRLDPWKATNGYFWTQNFTTDNTACLQFKYWFDGDGADPQVITISVANRTLLRQQYVYSNVWQSGRVTVPPGRDQVLLVNATRWLTHDTILFKDFVGHDGAC